MHYLKLVLTTTPTHQVPWRGNYGKLARNLKKERSYRHQKSQGPMIIPTPQVPWLLRFLKHRKKWRNPQPKKNPKNFCLMRIHTRRVPWLMRYLKHRKKWRSPHQKKISPRTLPITRVPLRKHKLWLTSLLKSHPLGSQRHLKPLKSFVYWLTYARTRKVKTE